MTHVYVKYNPYRMETEIKVNGKKISDVATLKEELYKHKIGDTVSIEYYHEGSKKTTNVKLTLEANDSNTTSASNEN